MASPDRTVRLIRLIRLATELKTNPAQTPTQLRRALGISESQYFRDKEMLAQMGFRYHWDRGRRTHVIDDDIFLPVLRLELTELFALAMAVRQLSATGDYTLSFGALSALKKIGASAGSEVRPLVQAALDEMVLREGFGCDPEVLEQLQLAIARRQVVRITYRSPASDWRPYETDVDPYQLYFKRRALYLDARCRQTNDIRTYRVNRISKIELRAAFFRVHDEYDPHTRHRQAWEVFAGGEPQRVVIRFSRRVAPYIREVHWHPTQRMEELPDGGLRFIVEVADPREVSWWAMGWGADAEVMEPEELRQQIAEECRKMLKNYDETQLNASNRSEG